MNETQALSRMIAPGTKRPNKWRGGIIQIHITRACDKSCYSCTQGSNLAGRPVMMTLENFEIACKSLVGYFGVVGVFGGNPALHPQFADICAILSKHIPYEQRGLWCNHPKGHGPLMAKTFNPYVSNLNVHQSQEAYDEFKRDWPNSRPFGLDSDSRHSPVFASMVDLGVPEAKRWELISNCDINHHWSALIGQFRGEPRAWFCEIAGAQSMLQQDRPCPTCRGTNPVFTNCPTCAGSGRYPDTGFYPHPGWWKEPMQHFASQVRFHCHQCGVPMRGHGQLANSTTDSEQTTKTYLPIFQPKRKRDVSLVTTPEELGTPLDLMTDYVGNAKK